MKLTKEVIEERMLCDFKVMMERFYVEEEQRYFNNLNERIDSGDIDRELSTSDETEKTLALKEAKKFFDEMPQKRVAFVKNYCNDANNVIFDSIKSGKLSEATGKIMFKILKHFILAAEMETDKSTKMVTRKNKR